ncbi:unnamed protein product [Microthlaspi erraticum]|uniref:FKB95-like N-terminal Kelch domain-containing protein n=1 Tax=Microthlaspi erraticum TaxID=1685480 RepID=A0A6D2JFU9_9BRAS|nr:unnamed protein product [Microthlaspi erraticum]
MALHAIDCRSHTVQILPSVPIPIFRSVAGIIDGKIYVTGYYHYDHDLKKVLRMVVFNTETQMWEPEMIEADTEAEPKRMYCGSVVMGDNIYMRDCLNSFVYE